MEQFLQKLFYGVAYLFADSAILYFLWNALILWNALSFNIPELQYFDAMMLIIMVRAFQKPKAPRHLREDK